MENSGASDHTPSGAATNPNVKPCAVCKVDLRGRFVVADEAFEALLGYSQDEVFGRSLTDLAPDQYHETINALLVQYSQYEPVHQTATIALCPASGDPISVTIITALNFVAGNAVNFQVMLTPCGDTVPVVVADDRSSGSVSLDDCLTLLDHSHAVDWSTAVMTLRDVAGAEECLVYRAADDGLELVNTSADPAAGAEAVTTAGETNDLHWWVANAHESYRFDRADNVQKALQAVSQAPTELLLPFADSQRESGLIRFTFAADEDKDSLRLASTMDRVSALVAAMQSAPTESKTTAGDTPLSLPVPTLWPVLADYMAGLLGEAVMAAVPLRHEAFAKLSAKEKVQLAKLQGSLYRAEEASKVMQQVGATGRKEKSQKTELDLVVGAVFERLQPELPPTVKLTTGDLPSITTRPGALERALTGLVRLATAAVPGPIETIRLTADTTDSECTLRLSVDSGAAPFESCAADLAAWLQGTRLAVGHLLIDQLLLGQAIDQLGASITGPDNAGNEILLRLVSS